MYGAVVSQEERNQRIAAAVAAVAIQGAILLALLYGLAVQQGVAPSPAAAVNAFNIALEKPKPPEATPSPKITKEPEGAAAPPSKRNKPKPIVVPTPKVRVPTRSEVRAAPVRGDGDAARSGAATQEGSGTGGGGAGAGTGSGRAGAGQGGAPRGEAARLIRGAIRNRDYPRSASRSREQGNVLVRFRVETNGRVTGCRIQRSSGNAAIDSTTCTLIEQRFVYDPAKDVAGNPVWSEIQWQQRYWLEGRND